MPETNWTPVLSSAQIAAYRYNAETRELDIVFHRAAKGEFYRYKAVPASTFEAFKAAPSKGQAFGALIRKAGYEYDKLTETEEGK